jgi:CheY-like chemotaxis protein
MPIVAMPTSVFSPECDRRLAEPGSFAESSTAMNSIASRTFLHDHDFPGTEVVASQGVVAIVSDDQATIGNLTPVCEFLDLKVELVSTAADLSHVLRDLNPMAVISDVEACGQDGFHTMKQVARYCRDLPVLLLTGGDSMLMGAADAVQDLWGLTAVTSTSEFPVAGQLVAFLFNAGRRAGRLRLLPV